MAAGGIVQVRLKSSSGISKHDVVNTFHTGPLPLNTDGLDDVSEAFADFYRLQLTSPVAAVGEFIGTTISRTIPHEITIYNLAQAEPRTPLHMNSFQIPAADLEMPLPREVACCLSMIASTVNVPNPGRYKGRVFIGPLNAAAINQTIGSVPTVAQNFRDVLLGAGVRLATELEAIMGTEDAALGVYSRVDDVVRGVRIFFVNDDFDTQRRRGLDPSVRQFAIVP